MLANFTSAAPPSARESRPNCWYYEINPATLGTFDLVMFFGVLYHLRNPLLALERIQQVCSGTLLMQTAICSNTSDTPMAEFHPFGVKSGPPDNPVCDTTCVWFPIPPAVSACWSIWGSKRRSAFRQALRWGEFLRRAAARRKATLPRQHGHVVCSRLQAPPEYRPGSALRLTLRIVLTLQTDSPDASPRSSCRILPMDSRCACRT